ncbi:MAG: SpoIID/LytB domain-containing protein [Bacteroidales bacterium]|jgi:stage II sporulation protein D|nr:SpoIID/LytB domain-containing protein [Bacteroidales bacterium]
MIRILLLSFIFLLPAATNCQVSIRIFARSRPSSVVFTPSRGDFILNDGAGRRLIIKELESVVITRYLEKVIYMTFTGESHLADSVTIVSPDDSALFLLRSPVGSEGTKRLDGSVMIKSYPGSLLVLNRTTVEKSLPGIVRAEAGGTGPGEYFRAQAVVARTYAYRNLERHALDGFNLCDDIHCQVYPGIISDSVIVKACTDTEGKVIVDSDNILIVSAFHANCGGETAASADVWVATHPYLVSVRDPWCTGSRSARWDKTVALDNWNEFLISKGLSPGQENILFSPPGTLPSRIFVRSVAGKNISNEDIRQHFALRSAYFTISRAENGIVFGGRGYGHGVGLCQDGARAMAADGKKFAEITGFYYPGTLITDVKNAKRPVRP